MNDRAGKMVLGLLLTAAGLWFAFLHSKSFERLADGSVQAHFDHTALYIGIGVALFGMLLVSPETVREALRDARAVVRRSSVSTPVQKDDEK